MKDPERGSGFGVGVSVSSISSESWPALDDSEGSASVSPSTSSFSNISKGAVSDMSETDVTGEPGSHGCDASSS